MLLGLGLGKVGGCIHTLPDVSPLATSNPTETRYRQLRALEGAVASPGREAWTPLGGIAPVLICAVVKAEDTEFFRHAGFDGPQLFRALMFAAQGSPKMGGSTLTQQLARNLYLDNQRTVQRKASEAWLALRLEQRVGKRRILELYLNVIEWGNGIWGVDAASRHYFGKSPAELDAFEASVLAALIPAPTRALEGVNLERAERVQRRALKQMRGSAIISPEVWQDASERASHLYAALASGLSLEDALARARPALPPAAAPAEEAGARRLEAILTTGCALDIR
ncbi:biosynthetic peptidoglycan transglycosylase [Corallococcus exercitus]|uniref:biosynthetic peptidoglycan transglycosylase n=1 Tax=Corallococcus exercitus TaxID=2316736 RepID=UPI0035D47A35